MQTIQASRMLSIAVTVAVGIVLSLSIVPFVSNAQTDPAPRPSGSGSGNPLPARDSGSVSGNPPADSDIGLVNPLRGIDSFEDLLARILEAVVRIASIFLTAAIIWVGFLFVKAQGNQEKLQDARRALMYTVIGGLILLGAQGISLVLQESVGTLSN